MEVFINHGFLLISSPVFAGVKEVLASKGQRQELAKLISIIYSNRR